MLRQAAAHWILMSFVADLRVSNLKKMASDTGLEKALETSKFATYDPNGMNA